MNPEKLKKILEAIIMASEHPVSLERMMYLFDENECPSKAQIQQTLATLMEEYKHHSIELIELANGFTFQVKAEYSNWVNRLRDERSPRYSRALLETLALIAYRQPITRAEIEDIRGVAVSSHIIKTLQERDWVRIVGYRDVPGKPGLYGTTRQFLDHFNLKSLEQLPQLIPLSEIANENNTYFCHQDEKQSEITLSIADNQKQMNEEAITA
ncbi:MAG: Segregation and condensation protein B [Legionellaceae bacterium]